MQEPKPNPAQIKGDINEGLTADKRPGFDPAAAPLETDSEAGGAAMSPDQVETARRTQSTGERPRDPGSYGNAMRATADARGERRADRSLWLIVLIVVAAIAAAAVVLLA